MAFPLALLIPVIPEIIKQLKTRPKSGVKEVSGIGIIAALSFIANDATTCALDGISALSCVPIDHWSMLIVSALALVARLNGKRNEASK